ncbi:MAG: hypothetical protein HY443_00250 [Candidatus Nealsonbacteria bacterium]|nr:hypothetical protein [Candidatus Nealsonbacteria bacterium]
MEKKILILHVPVIHRGYLDFFEKSREQFSGIFILSREFLDELSETKPDIASLEESTVKDLLQKMGFNGIAILYRNDMDRVRGKNIVLIQDEISRNLAKKYLPGENIEWQSVFLRWDREKVLAENSPGDIKISREENDLRMIEEARLESRKTGDWWRQIGAVLVKDGEIVFRGFNRDLPSDHTPYQVGEVRDFFRAGERHDLASTIHAEENIIAQAAKKGVSLEGSSLYVTTFPCPVCAKLIACSGIKKLYFAQGGSNFDAKIVLESSGVDIVQVLR